MDIDDFKQINDSMGHLEGDRALIQFANVLKLTADSYNSLIARYGGDEFCALLKVNSEREKVHPGSSAAFFRSIHCRS